MRQSFIVIWTWDILTVSVNRYQSPNRRDMMSTNLWIKAAIDNFFMCYGNNVVVVCSMQWYCVSTLQAYGFFPVICCLATKIFILNQLS